MSGHRPAARAATLVVIAALAAALGACNDDAGSPKELCSVLGDGRSFTSLFEQGFDPTDPQRALTQLEAASVDLDQLHTAAPSEVRDDLEQEAAYIDAVIRVLRQEDPDDPAAVVAAINALSAEREAAEVASLELRAFEEAHCR